MPSFGFHEFLEDQPAIQFRSWVRLAHCRLVFPRHPQHLSVLYLEPVLSDKDTAVLDLVDAQIPELCIRSLAGSYQEGTVRCIMDIAETYLDRPAGMYDVARGQCRSLAEDPKRKRQLDMPSATAAARSIRPFSKPFMRTSSAMLSR